MKYLNFINNTRNDSVGNKNISANTHSISVNVPNGFVTNDEAYSEFLQVNNLQDKIEDILIDSDFKDTQILHTVGTEIREIIFNTPLPQDVQSELQSAYTDISVYYNTDEFDTAIHASTESIDIPDMHLDIIEPTCDGLKGTQLLYKKIQERYASLFTDRAIYYRNFRGYNHFSFSTKFILRLQEKRFDEKYVHLAIA